MFVKCLLSFLASLAEDISTGAWMHLQKTKRSKKCGAQPVGIRTTRFTKGTVWMIMITDPHSHVWVYDINHLTQRTYKVGKALCPVDQRTKPAIWKPLNAGLENLSLKSCRRSIKISQTSEKIYANQIACNNEVFKGKNCIDPSKVFQGKRNKSCSYEYARIQGIEIKTHFK